MSRKLWSASLVGSSPHYAEWRKILDSDEVPIVSPRVEFAQLGPEESVGIYRLDVVRLSRDQHARLVDFICDRFGVKGREAVQGLESDGFPIRAADVSISYDVRAFL